MNSSLYFILLNNFKELSAKISEICGQTLEYILPHYTQIPADTRSIFNKTIQRQKKNTND